MAPKKATTSTATRKRKAADDAAAPAAKKAKELTKKELTAKTTTKKTTTKQATTDKPTTTANTTAARKRKAAEDAASPAAKKAKTLIKGAIINEPPTQPLNVYVFGEGSGGELGLGTAKIAVDVKRPRLNPHLAADKVGVVQVEAGGMHAIALTQHNKILTWGVNDQGALGRDTQWDGGLKDMDASSDNSDDEDDNNGLNPLESTPGEVDFSTTEVAAGTRFTEVAAGDSCSFALTDDGRVYGWGTFRGNDGIIGFTPDVQVATKPVLIAGIKDITSIKTGSNHCFALDSKGKVFSWGAGQQDQLGRRVIERTAKAEGLKPREFGLPKGPKKGVVAIESGAYHGFAITKTGDVYSWGLNNMGETGIMEGAGTDEATVRPAQLVESLKGKEVISIKGGAHHSIAATKGGDCLVWGRLDGCQMGIAEDEMAKLPENATIKDERKQPRILKIPTKVSAIHGAVTKVTASSDHNIAITNEGKAWSWGFSANYQTGQGTTEDIPVATMIDNTAIREQKINGATTGGQFSILTAPAS